MLKRFIFFLIVLLFVACINNKKKNLPYWQEPISGMGFVLIPKGNFYMGNTSTNKSSNNDQLHLVTITENFWLAEMEVTQGQWQKVMGNKELHPEKPSPFRNDNPHYPVVSISYYDIQNFLRKLEKLSPKNQFRLPTEAEWEYACRAGTVTAFSNGSHISDSLANFKADFPSKYASIGEYIGHPTPVGSYPPNPWGLYDMHGNVWEWVSDWYAPYSSKHLIDPKGPQSGTMKVIRGGSWYFSADNARSYFRKTHYPKTWGFSIGFRIVCEKNEK